MRFLLCLVLLLAVVAQVRGTRRHPISPEDIAAARQACTTQCHDNDKVVMAKCMRACWKNFFDEHHTATPTTTTAHKKRKVRAVTHAPHKAPVKAVEAKKPHPHHPIAPAAHKKVVRRTPKMPQQGSAFEEVPLDHSLGHMGRSTAKSMARVLRADASNLVVNAGLLVFLLTAGAFLMA
jgi:hypothetical protein